MAAIAVYDCRYGDSNLTEMSFVTVSAIEMLMIMGKVLVWGVITLIIALTGFCSDCGEYFELMVTVIIIIA